MCEGGRGGGGKARGKRERRKKRVTKRISNLTFSLSFITSASFSLASVCVCVWGKDIREEEEEHVMEDRKRGRIERRKIRE